MARLMLAFAIALLPVPAWSQSGSLAGKPSPTPPALQTGEPRLQARSLELPIAPESPQSKSRRFAATEIGPNATFGLGIFGLRQERFGIAPTTVSEVNSPRTRRPAFGFTFKF